MLSSPPCFAQRQEELRPPPLTPAEAKQQARALVAEMLAQTPEQNTTNSGSVIIMDAEDHERQVPLLLETVVTPSHWSSVYQTQPTGGSPGPERLTVTHSDEQPNRYELTESVKPGATNTLTRQLTAAQTMQPFAGSDFWIADLGLEFLHWPGQRLLKKEMRHSKFCDVLESVNQAPIPGGYTRVVSWVMAESPHGIVHADAYDAQGKLLKQFDPKDIEKVNGEYRVDEMMMRNRQTGARTIIKLNFEDKPR